MSDLAQSPSVARLIPAGEKVILAMRPGVLYIPLSRLGNIVLLIVVAYLAVWGLDRLAVAAAGDRDTARRLKDSAGYIGIAGTAAVALRLLWQVLEWWCRLYVLTDKRVVRAAGVLQRSVIDIPLQNIQHTTIFRSLRERLAGLGTIGINTSGTAFTEMFWEMVAKPTQTHAAIRAAIATTSPTGSAPPQDPTSPARPLILGLSGAIGSGKSAVARELGRRGALVIDSDQEAKQALDRPLVRNELVKWWGPSILDPDDRVDRAKVAAIIFSDPEQRRRLETLVHPLVRQTRAALVKQAADKGVRLVVVDAPLLYEAGVDQECDKVVFVDAPRATRLDRVHRTRGWSDDELTRREKAQLPLEEKRSRADAIITNDADEAQLALRVGQFLTSIGL